MLLWLLTSPIISASSCAAGSLSPPEGNSRLWVRGAASVVPLLDWGVEQRGFGKAHTGEPQSALSWSVLGGLAVFLLWRTGQPWQRRSI